MTNIMHTTPHDPVDPYRAALERRLRNLSPEERDKALSWIADVADLIEVYGLTTREPSAMSAPTSGVASIDPRHKRFSMIRRMLSDRHGGWAAATTRHKRFSMIRRMLRVSTGTRR